MLSPLPCPPATLPFALTMKGSAQLAEPLAAALRCQWAYGFPIVPKPAQQLTHGFFHYPAGMQPVAAAHMLSVLPSGVLLDPFVGGGTTLVEGLRCGWRTIGADASPLALFASAHHTWLASDDQLAELREHATQALHAVDPTFEANPLVPATAVDAGADVSADDDRAAAFGQAKNLERQPKLEGGRRDDATTFASWEPLRDAVEWVVANADGGIGDESAATEPSPLWFCYAAAQQRSERYRYKDPLASFDATVSAYCAAASSLRAHTPPATRLSSAEPSAPAVRLVLSDARELDLTASGLPLADAVLCSPPYAGVYDYLSHARESRARLGARGESVLMGLRGTPDGRDWPQAWRSSNEMGARKAMYRPAALYPNEAP